MLYLITKHSNNLQNDNQIIQTEDGEYLFTQHSSIEEKSKHINQYKEDLQEDSEDIDIDMGSTDLKNMIKSGGEKKPEIN